MMWRKKMKMNEQEFQERIDCDICGNYQFDKIPKLRMEGIGDHLFTNHFDIYICKSCGNAKLRRIGVK